MPATRRRGSETKPALEARAKEIFRRLRQRYPDAHCELDFRNAFELLCATILSAQWTDARVNLVTPELFRRYPDAESLAVAQPEAVEDLIRSTGFFRNKTKSLIGMANAVVDRYSGQIPDSMEALTALPGVGRKTANVILGNAFGINEGIAVDTHVARLSGLLRLSRNTDPERIERDLMALFPRRDWAMVSHLLIFHGRRTCIARRPKCGECVVADLCPSAQV